MFGPQILLEHVFFLQWQRSQWLQNWEPHEDLSYISLCNSLRTSSLASPAAARDKQRDPNPFALCVFMIILRSSANRFHCTCRARESIIDHKCRDIGWSVYKSTPYCVKFLGIKEFYTYKYSLLYMQIFTFLLSGVKLFPPQRMKMLGVLVELSPSFNDPISRVARLTFDYLWTAQCHITPSPKWIADHAFSSTLAKLIQLALECFQQRQFPGNS